MRDMRDWLNSKYLSAMDLMKDDGSGYHKGTVEIATISEPQVVQLGAEKERLPIATFKRRRKEMILRDSHLKKLIEIFGPDAAGPIGKEVGLWVELDVNCYGTKRDCVRFEAVTGSTRRSLMPTHQGTNRPADAGMTPAEEEALVASVVTPDGPVVLETEPYQKALAAIKERPGVTFQKLNDENDWGLGKLGDVPADMFEELMTAIHLAGPAADVEAK